MAENLGRIEYQFAAETDGVLKAGAAVDKATDKMVQDFSKVDKSVKNFNTQTTKTAQGVKRAFGNNLGQAGIQVQQFVGQLQGGQSAMVALAQQSADLGIVLGAPMIGVIVSLAAVLAGTLAPAIFGTVSNIEKLEKAIENTKTIMTLGKNGIIEYTDEMKRLETASENLAKIKIALAITENSKAIKESRKEFSSLRADLFNFQEDASEAAKRLTGMTDKTSDMLDLASSLQSFTSAITDEDKLKRLERSEQILLSMRNDKGEFPSKDLAEFAQKFFALSDATRQAITANQALKKSNEDLNTSSSESGESFEKLRISLKEQTIALQDGERAAFKYSLLMSGEYSAAQIKAALKIYDTNQALMQQKQEAETSADALKKVNAELDAYFEKEAQDSIDQEAKEKGKAENFAQGIVDRGMTEPERFANELAELTELRKQGLLSQQLYDAAVVSSAEQRARQLDKANKNQTDSNQMSISQQANMLGAMANIFGSFANSMDTNNKESFEKWKKYALAQAAISTAMGIANALATPAPWPVAAAMGVAAGVAGAVQIATISGQEYSGGRQYGGPVSQGMYRVNETGVPELYSHGGKDYLMNTKNANIKPLKESGGGGMQVIVNNHTPNEIYVTQDQAANIANIQIGVEAGKAAKGTGQMLAGMQRGANLKTNARN